MSKSVPMMRAKKKAPKPKKYRDALLNASTQNLHISIRAWNNLVADNKTLIGDVTKLTEAELRKVPGFDPEQVKDVKTALGKKGLRLRK